MSGWRRTIAIACRLVGVVVAACITTGCVTTSAPVALEQAAGATISFDSIDGPPRPIYERLVKTLSDEAGARRLVVVPRGRESNYRIRGYLALQAGTVAWAWDVYDSDRRRAFRMTGSDPGTGSWAALDDAALRRIARTGIEQLTAFIAADRGPASRAVASSSVPEAHAALAAAPAKMAAAATDR